MDYLIYVEHNAENLQFYLWYRDYVQRFEALPKAAQALSPEWVPEKEARKLGKDQERHTPNKLAKRRQASTASAMKPGFDVSTSTFAEEMNEAGFHKPGNHKASTFVIKDKEMFISEGTSTESNELNDFQTAGLTWQPCTLIFSHLTSHS